MELLSALAERLVPRAVVDCLQKLDGLLEVGPDRRVGPRRSQRGEVLQSEAREAAGAPAWRQ